MGDTTQIGIELEKKEAAALETKIKAKLESMVREAKNGDKAHNAIADAVEVLGDSQVWNMNHGLATFEEMRGMRKGITTDVSGIVSEAIKDCSANQPKAKSTIKLPGGIEANGQDAVRVLGVLALIYLIAKAHGVF